MERKPTMRDCTSDYLEVVTRQMEKDLALSGFVHSFISKDPKKLIDELARLLDSVGASTVQNILYRVDLAEADNRTQLNKTILSEKLWNRVLQKVWFRLEYTSM